MSGKRAISGTKPMFHTHWKYISEGEIGVTNRLCMDIFKAYFVQKSPLQRKGMPYEEKSFFGGQNSSLQVINNLWYCQAFLIDSLNLFCLYRLICFLLELLPFFFSLSSLSLLLILESNNKKIVSVRLVCFVPPSNFEKVIFPCGLKLKYILKCFSFWFSISNRGTYIVIQIYYFKY